jgi:PKD repeat protein
MKRTVLLAAIAAAVLTAVVGCALFVNRPPVARISVTPPTGDSPLLVSFSAERSYDPDGSIRSYAWDFGDGDEAARATVDHVYAPSSLTVYTATLVVEDDGGATATAQQSVEVTVAPALSNNPPFPRFTFDPTHGDTPLTVEFDASLSSDVDGDVVVYAWDFGDGTTGSGVVISHEYTALANTDYAVTLTATDDGGASASTTAIVSVYVEEIVPFDGPTAELAVSDPQLVYDSVQLPDIPSLFQVTFTPEGSVAAPGHTIETYVWSFGDGESTSLGTANAVVHTYRSGAPIHTFIASLTVIDDQGLQDSVVANVTVVND